MATLNWVNICSGYGLLPGSTKPLPEPMLTWRCKVQWHSSGDYFTRYFSHQSLKLPWKLPHPKFHSNLKGTNKLRQFYHNENPCDGDKLSIVNSPPISSVYVSRADYRLVLSQWEMSFKLSKWVINWSASIHSKIMEITVSTFTDKKISFK